jgi:hypothetical protein
MKKNNQADLFDQPQKLEEMKKLNPNTDQQALIIKVKKMSERLKYLMGGILYTKKSES